MDNPATGGRSLPGSTCGILDLEPSIHRHHSHLQQMGLTSGQLMGLFDDPTKPPSAKVASVNTPKGKGISGISPFANSTSDDDEEEEEEEGPSEDNGCANSGRTKKGSPWQRMKWTDDMVRLLITVVSYVGDDGTPEASDVAAGKRKGGGSGALQKKGKWKTVSKLMLEKGCCVSPQQCEDKFNDLNKRYKRLNEILGRGTTCRVVENPALLDSMSHVSPKAKDDVRKILSSKHLFYREMCAYHNGQRIPNSHEIELRGCGSVYEDDLEEEEEEDEEEREVDFGKKGDSLVVEMDSVLQDRTKSVWEQGAWFRKRTLELQEERVEILLEAFELEKRRFQWRRFCSKKDRELERMRLENERLCLENQRMALQVRQKEAELDFKGSGELVGEPTDDHKYGILAGMNLQQSFHKP